MRLSQDRLLFLVLLCGHVSIRTAVPIELDNNKGIKNLIMDTKLIVLSCQNRKFALSIIHCDSIIIDCVLLSDESR